MQYCNFIRMECLCVCVFWFILWLFREGQPKSYTMNQNIHTQTFLTYKITLLLYIQVPNQKPA